MLLIPAPRLPFVDIIELLAAETIEFDWLIMLLPPPLAIITVVLESTTRLIRSHHIRWIAIVLGSIERSYDELGPYKSRVYNLNSTIMTDPYMVLEPERAYELLAGYGYCWVHTVPRCCYPACRSIGTLPAGPSLK